MKTKMGVTGILMGVMFLSMVFGALVFVPQFSENTRAFEPSYLEFMMPDDDALAIFVEDDEKEASINSTDDSGGFSVIRTGLSATTSNPTGYKIVASAVGKDNNGNVTEKLVFDHPKATATIPSLTENVTVVRLKDSDDGSELWNAANFPNNHWGIGIASSEPTHVFRPISVGGTKIKTTDGPAENDKTTVLIGIKADKKTPPGVYTNAIEFTALANPVPYIYMLEYDANGGVSPRADIVTAFNQATYSMIVTDVIPTRVDHSSGSWTFLGWDENPEATVPDIMPRSIVDLSATDSSTQESRTVLKTIYAVWQKNYNYALAFDSGTDDPASDLPETLTATSTSDAVFTIPANIPTRRGYDFSGWTDGTHQYQPGETYTIPTTAEGHNPITQVLTAKWTPKNYTVSVENSSTSTGSIVNLAVPYDGSRTIDVTPDVGHYLSEVSCPDGYTCSGYETGADEIGTQTVTITNNRTVNSGTVSFSGGLSEYKVAIVPSLNAVTDTNSLTIPYGGSKTFTIEPTGDYYLNGIKCADGYTCSGYRIGNNSTARGLQAVTVTNDHTPSAGAISFVASMHTPLSSIEYMQDITPKVVLETEVGASKTLVDKRDGKSYLVAKLKDGKIWMAQDLQLGGDNDMVLTPEDTNVSENFTLKAQNAGDWCADASLKSCVNQSMVTKTGVPNGYLYNWYAATAGTGTYDNAIDDASASSSICPKGWSLPRGGANATVGNDFYYLAQQYGMSSPGTNRTVFNNLMAKPFPGFNYTGYRPKSAPSETNSLSYYWSSTSANHINVYGLRLDSSTRVSPADLGNTKNTGYGMRCVASPQLRIENSNTNSDVFGVDIMSYGEIKSIIVTPVNKDYYLSKVECPEGYTCSGYYTDKAHPGQQVVKIRNDGATKIGILKFIASPISDCSASTTIGSTCMYGADKVDAVRLKDGKFWTKRALAAVKWNDINTVPCPAGMNRPTPVDYKNLILSYGGVSNTGYGSPYGSVDSDTDIHSAIGWTGAYWAATTQYDSSRGWRFYLYGSSTVLNYANKTDANQIGCYGII